MREGSAPNFCPPVEEGAIYSFEDEAGAITDLEFLGVILHEERSYAFFLPAEGEGEDGEFCELILLEVVACDEDGQPAEFELVVDEAIAQEVYEDFKQATKELYEFE